MELSTLIPFPFNVKNYGALGNGTTDDTAAIQAAINACHAAGGGTVYFPRGIYFVNGDLITNVYGGANPNCQILIPKTSTPASGGKPITIALEMETAPPIVQGPLVDNRADEWDKGTFIKSTKTGSGTRPAVFGTVGDGDSYGSFNFVDVAFKNFWVRTKPGGSMGGINMGAAINTDFRRTMVDTSVAGIDTVVPVGNVFGIIGGLTNGGTMYPFNETLTVGYKYGYLFGEHSTGDNIQAMCCDTAFAFQGGAHHAISLGRLGSFWCKWNIEAEVVSAGYAHLNIAQLDIEQKVTGHWTDYVGNVKDPNSMLEGRLIYQCVSSGVGDTPHGFTNTGAQKLLCESNNYLQHKSLNEAIENDGNTVKVNAFIHSSVSLTLDSNKALAFTRLQPGKSGKVFIRQDGTGGRTLTIPAGKAFGGTLATTAGALTVLNWWWDGVDLVYELKQAS